MVLLPKLLQKAMTVKKMPAGSIRNILRGRHEKREGALQEALSLNHILLTLQSAVPESLQR